ncbi:CDP-alcohol phosphatidyltransferase family protein [Maribacter sp. PR1]|uniref:CDP-alcohol phosphatidyltransferase family protein n=1 Tax=Maribacter cobaltidurans TaxID=1178778 RepID=A0ABU7IZR8_9FLAO|nr:MULTISPECIES: CDP-alcohol phosphatidyltransferase family protein [Maribacter]MDC6391098.1 CDP-alcohol phosphatidyltransferase family protein [Maribacter sp. PR1]MEE1978490.1 CDP-alcohol phosphatidyltransferase family protein [Maribacter cobaltidurans]
MQKHIPNFITLLNVFCGCVATVFAVMNKLEMAAIFVALGIFFDFFDGLAARVLDVKSELGLQLDSLADMITSGLVPGIVMFQLLAMSQSGGWNLDGVSFLENNEFTWISLLPFFGFLITMASAYRLANFNLDENQVSSFIGLPTPANALMILSLPLILFYNGSDTVNEVILNPWFLVLLTILSAYLLNCSLSLFALKFNNWSFKDNAMRYIFLVVSLVMIITMQFLAIPFIILFYILSSFIQEKF